MKIAIVGSRNIRLKNLEKYLPEDITEIVSGGAKGVDLCAKEYAKTHGISYKEFLPDYEKYGRSAPLRRNDEIINYADKILAFWDGKSRGTKYVIDNCRKQEKIIEIFLPGEENFD